MHLSLKERFFQKVEFIPFHDCWEWTGAKGPRGHGRIWIDSKTKCTMAHRVSYEFNIGPIPRNLQVCHSCDNPGCVRPEHLFLGTNQDNVDDMIKKGRQLKGSQKPNAKLDEKKVLEIVDLHSKGFSKTEIAKTFNVSRRLIGGVICGKRWRHVSHGSFIS